MGPLTAGFERWANLPPSQSNLQSFGHASVLEDGRLEIKLMNIDGSVMYEKTLSPPVSDPASGNAGGSSAATAKSFMWFVFLVVMATGAI